MENINLKSKSYKKLISVNKIEKKEKSEKQDIKIYPKIISIKYIDNETLNVFLNTNCWYSITYSLNDKDAISFYSNTYYCL